MKHYELLFVLKPTLTEEEIQNQVALLKEVLEKNGGEIVSIKEMGTRRLAYMVNKFERGIYFVFYFTAPATSISEIERIIRINEDIIKFMTVKFESKKEVQSWDILSKQKKEDSKKEPKPKAEKEPETKSETNETKEPKENTQETLDK